MESPAPTVQVAILEGAEAERLLAVVCGQDRLVGWVCRGEVARIRMSLPSPAHTLTRKSRDSRLRLSAGTCDVSDTSLQIFEWLHRFWSMRVLQAERRSGSRHGACSVWLHPHSRPCTAQCHSPLLQLAHDRHDRVSVLGKVAVQHWHAACGGGEEARRTATAPTDPLLNHTHQLRWKPSMRKREVLSVAISTGLVFSRDVLMANKCALSSCGRAG